MPLYPTPPNIVAEIRSLQKRVSLLERQMANLRGAGGGGGGPVYDSNVIWNGSMESGTSGWGLGYGNGTGGTIAVESANPLNGLRSLRMDEHANSGTEVWWNPTGGALAGSDVFATAPGEQWLLTATLRSTVPITHAQLVGICGTVESDCYGLFGNQTFVSAADVPLTANTITPVSGLITVPASRNFVTVMVLAGKNDSPMPTVPYSWWLDDVSLQKKL
jgi:hypothetical protein